MIVGAVASLLLYLNWAGEQFGWTDPTALVLVIAAIVLTVLFVFVELRTKEPIIPMRLFRNPIFSVGNLFGFLIGFGIFGGAIYIPLYLQTVKGFTPTRSGLGMLPMVIGMFSMSILAGQLITRTGKYKIYPIVGSIVLIISLFLLSTLQWDTPYWQLAIYAFLFGLGLGLAMTTIVTPVQNSVQARDIGVATSATTFGRSLGGAIGAAFFGAVMSSQLAKYLVRIPEVKSGAVSLGAIDTNDLDAIHKLPEPLKTNVLIAFTNSVTDVFLYLIPIVVLALVVVLFLKEIPLRTTAPILEEQREEALADEFAPVAMH
jgi:predicted MFS family arabinose efflux permease